MTTASHQLIPLDTQRPIWDRFFSVAPLVVIGSRESDGSYDFAPKHRAMPLGDANYFGFICTPRHRTYHNIVREKAFTVSYLHPDQILAASLSATPRDTDHQKPALQALPTMAATVVDGQLLTDAVLYLECKLFKIVDGFGENSLIAGAVVAAQIDASALRSSDEDDQDILLRSPLLSYIAPGRYAQITQSHSFPFHVGFQP